MRKEKLRLIIFPVVFLVITGVLGLVFWPLISDVQNPEYREIFSVWVAGLGIRGVFILFGIQILQIVIAVIPGQPVALIAGAAYGAWIGLLILMAGCAVATMLVFFLVKKFGLPLIKRFIGAEAISTWGFLASEKKVALVTFILFLIPGLPKDTLTYLAPLSRLSLVSFTTISVFARFPAMLSTTVMGDAAIQGNWSLFLIVFAITAISGVLGIQIRNSIIQQRKNAA